MKFESGLIGKRITLVRNLEKANEKGELAIEVEGLVEVIAPDGSALVIRPKNSTMNLMLEPHEIEPDSIYVHIEKPKEIKSRKMGILTASNARQHLLDRHAVSLSFVNGLTDEAALQMHDNTNHKDLGHYHSEED